MVKAKEEKMGNQDKETVPKKGFGYLRVSTEEQVDGASLANQKEKIEEYASRHNITIVGWFEDPGISAKTANRPGLQKMLKECLARKGEIDYVIVYNMTRMSRDLITFYGDILKILQKVGIEIRSATEEAIDGSVQGELYMGFALLNGFLDNRNKAVTVKDNMRYVVRQGWWLSAPPLGYAIEKVVIGTDKYGKPKKRLLLVPDKKNNLGDKIGMLLTRFSEGDIGEADLLRMAHKMEIYSAQGKLLPFNTLDRMLRNPVYAGYNDSPSLLEKGEMVKMKSDGLITLDTFKKNQIILSGTKRVLQISPDEMYPLKRTLVCSRCGRYLTASAPKGGSGKGSPRYHCRHKGHGSIGATETHLLFNEFLEQVTPNEDTIKLFKSIVKRTAAKKLGNANKQLAELHRQEDNLTEEKNKAYHAFLNNQMSEEDKDAYVGSIETRREAVKKERMKLEHVQQLNEATIEYVMNFMTKPAKLWRDSDLESRKAFQEILFPNGLQIDIKGRKCGTEDLSSLFSVINVKKEPMGSSNYSCGDLSGN